jgi:STIP1 family protein 1
VRQSRGSTHTDTREERDGLTVFPHVRSIVADPTEPTLYTNRAMARLRMSLWDLVISDCNDCLQRKPDSKVEMKANYYLAQAHLAMRDYDSAVNHALVAHKMCSDKSLESITELVLRCKKERWEDREKRRRREGAELEIEVMDVLERERDAALAQCSAADDGERQELQSEWETKLRNMRATFDNARAADSRRREVPEWVVDDISFSIMVDPVVVSILAAFPSPTC